MRNPLFHEPRYVALCVFSPSPLAKTPIPESLIPNHDVYSTAQEDVWALGCILAEMIGNVRPWSLAIPEDNDYNDYLLKRSVLFDRLSVSHAAYLLLRKIFSTRSDLRPSLTAIRSEVVAMDTFFLSDEEAIGCG